MKQTAVAAGRVATLTKKFSNEGLVDADPVQMLQAALGRLKTPVRRSKPPARLMRYFPVLLRRLEGCRAYCSP